MTPTDLRALHATLGLPTWAATAAALGVSRATVFRYLKGRQEIPETVALLVKCILDRRQDGPPRHTLGG